MQLETKFVDFHKYCLLCKNQSLAEDKDPCHDCLNSPTNINSHKPVMFEEK